ncbi:MAG: hypothetical protein LAO03_10305 [Acidobacteriia bacterium]|nr:hypothetical protein [Terriglobia bacterium]
MKFWKNVALAMTLAVSLVLVAQAAETNQGNITLSAISQVGSQPIKAGDYTVQWEGSGPSVQVKILRGKKVVATSTANLVQQNAPSARDEVHLRVQDNGTRMVERIDFAKRGVSLVFGETQSSTGQ